MVCWEANLIDKLIVGDASPRLQQLVERWIADSWQFVAPSLIGYEVTNALHRIRLVAKHNPEINESMKSYELFAIEPVQDIALHVEALDFAGRFRLSTAYDSHYLALSNRLSIDFWTADARLHRAVKSELSWDRLVE
jgi:predicted nucleic acid-binding protein